MPFAPVEKRIVGLLRTLELARQAWDDRAAGGGVRMMPGIYHQGSYVELERHLREMRDGPPSERRLWWHVSERYLRGDERVARVECRRTRKGALAVAPAHSEIAVVVEVGRRDALVRLRVWNAAVDAAVVDAGVRELASRMYRGDHGRVVLPRELMSLVGVA